jgi:hypothetical protein
MHVFEFVWPPGPVDEEVRIKFSLIIAEWIQEAHLPVERGKLGRDREEALRPFIQAVPFATALAAWSTAAGSRIASLQCIPCAGTAQLQLLKSWLADSWRPAREVVRQLLLLQL